MKRIEDIEMMTPDELESAAMAEDIQVPKGLEERIEESLAAKTAAEAVHERPIVRRAVYAFAAIAAILAAAVIIPRTDGVALKDTYDDPYLAYAQVEATFQKMSDKMAIGVELAAKAGQTAEKPAQIINKISK